MICSVDKARELGLDWWNHDARLSRQAGEQQAALAAMDQRLGRIEQALGASALGANAAAVEQREPA